MRVALFARVPEAVVHLDAAVRALGHESVGVVTSPGPAGRYGAEPFSALVDAAPPHLDILVAHSRTPARRTPRGWPRSRPGRRPDRRPRLGRAPGRGSRPCR